MTLFLCSSSIDSSLVEFWLFVFFLSLVAYVTLVNFDSFLCLIACVSLVGFCSFVFIFQVLPRWQRRWWRWVWRAERSALKPRWFGWPASNKSKFEMSYISTVDTSDRPKTKFKPKFRLNQNRIETEIQSIPKPKLFFIIASC